jgi:hypothetical protein
LHSSTLTLTPPPPLPLYVKFIRLVAYLGYVRLAITKISIPTPNSANMPLTIKKMKVHHCPWSKESTFPGCQVIFFVCCLVEHKTKIFYFKEIAKGWVILVK